MSEILDSQPNTLETLTASPQYLAQERINKFKRDESGLLAHIEYKYMPDGRVDWKKMFLPEHLYLRKDRKAQIEATYEKPFEDIDVIKDNVSDEFLLSTLAGARYLLWLRGFYSINYHVDVAAPDYSAVTCSIIFVRNFETDANMASDVGHACLNSVTGNKTYQSYLPEIASNRAFVRTIRSFLNISIVSKEEVIEKFEKQEDGAVNPMVDMIRKKLKSLGKADKDSAISYIRSLGVELDSSVEKLSQLPSSELVTIMGKLKEVKS